MYDFFIFRFALEWRVATPDSGRPQETSMDIVSFGSLPNTPLLRTPLSGRTTIPLSLRKVSRPVNKKDITRDMTALGSRIAVGRVLHELCHKRTNELTQPETRLHSTATLSLTVVGWDNFGPL